MRTRAFASWALLVLAALPTLAADQTRPVRPPTADWYIVLFDQANCRGNYSARCVVLDSSAPDLSSLGLRGWVLSVRPAVQPR
jgi:hypothetical protein